MNLTARAKIVFRASPERAFGAFADPQLMSRFWFTRHDQGLQEGKMVAWYIGDGPEAPAIDVRVKEIKHPTRLHIEWGQGGQFTDVLWTFERTDAGDTIVQIVESGFALEGDALLARVLDSTAGFNQVILAAKALVEHDTSINVVADHV